MSMARRRPQDARRVHTSARGHTSLFRRLLVAYAGVLAVAVAVLIFAPVTVSVPVTFTELVGILAAALLMLASYRILLQRALEPLQRLAALMERVDPLAPGQRVDLDIRDTEVAAVAGAFNAMLDRLEGERRESARRALAAQEDERRRIARELHDEIGQVLTGLILRSETLARRAPPEFRGDIEGLREAARHGAEDVRTIARRLRPEALDELGLQSALLALCTDVADHSGIVVTRNLERDLPLNTEQELVIYRVAQESMTNVVRHAQAAHVDVSLTREDGGVLLTISDDGVGLPPDAHASATGLLGMRERALLVGAEISIERLHRSGTQVRLYLPSSEFMA
jgi:two-component system sensor histidine kinase UhpB